MNRLILILCICLSFCVASVHAQAPSGDRLEVFKKYLLEKDYPEVFKEPYRARIENILDVDVDNDGVKELVVHFQPHFRQSPSIIIYKVSPKLELTRVTEALAPGHFRNSQAITSIPTILEWPLTSSCRAQDRCKKW
jgi:hypothetical protein